MSWFDIVLFRSSGQKHVIDLSFVSSKAINIISLPFLILFSAGGRSPHLRPLRMLTDVTTCLLDIAGMLADSLPIRPEQSPAPSWFDSALPGNNWSVPRWLHLRVHNPASNLMPRVYREWSHLPKPIHCQGQLYNAVATSEFHSQLGLENKNENAVKIY